jgi:metal-sulfur cluster biosynthetic enzyme
VSADRFEYSGDALLRPRLCAALKRVIDPEMALDVVELGLVYRLEAGNEFTRVRVTMTSAACPVAEHIVEEIGHELRSSRPGVPVDVQLVWDPPWTPERMSAPARAAMGWE